MKPTFAGEIQLAGWSESHNSGCKVTFWLQSPDDLEPFRALTVRKGNTAGHRFMAALVEIGDDEQPVQEPEKLDSMRVAKGGPLSKEAAMLCQNPAFQVWIGAEDEKQAAYLMRHKCGMSSRAELDTNPMLADKFISLFRLPFMRWKSKAT